MKPITQPSMQPKVQLKALTGIRFFAALAVIAFHLYLAAPGAFPRYAAGIASYGFIGVSLFFVLSGFVLAYNYVGKPIDRQKFWVARFARVYPAYLVALVIGLLTCWEIAQHQSPNWMLTQLLLEVPMLHTWLPWTACGINCPGWSVAVEAFFYALFPFIAAAAVKAFGQLTPSRTVGAILMLWAAAMLIPALCVLLVPGFPAKGVYTLLFDALIYNPLLNVPQFLMGMCAGALFVQKTSSGNEARKDACAPLQSRSLVLAMLAGLVGLAALILMTPEQPMFTLLLRLGLFSPMFALIIYALAHGQGLVVKILALPPLIVLGEASYGIYILETPLNRVLKLLSEAGWFPRYGTFVYGVAFLLVLIAAAIASLHLIETPARKHLTQAKKKRASALEITYALPRPLVRNEHKEAKN